MSEEEDLKLEALFADGVALETGGAFVAIPSMPLLRDVTDDEVSTAKAVKDGKVKQESTGKLPSIPPEIDDVRIGDKVTIPNGRTLTIYWIAPDKRRIGVGNRKGGGYEFFSLHQVTRVPGEEVAKEVEKKATKDAKEEGRPAPKKKKKKKMPKSISVPKGMKLYAHQIKSVEFLAEKGRGIIGSEMGTGKTAVAIVAMEAPVVVVCPSTLKVNWAREIAMWRPELSVAIVEGTSPEKKTEMFDAKTHGQRKRRTSRKAKPTEAALRKKVKKVQSTADVVIINYDILAPHAEWLLERSNKTLIADEAHYLKTMKIKFNRRQKKSYIDGGSQRATVFYRMQEEIDNLYLLSGTPILNRVKELFPLLNMTDSQRWGNWYEFAIRYCSAFNEWVKIKGGGGAEKQTFNADGRSNSDELHEIISGDYMLRYTKAACIDLPPKSRKTTVVSLSPEAKRTYRSASQNFLKWVSENGGPEAVFSAELAEALTKINALRQITVEGKIPAAIQWITRFFESTGRPLVVFGLHRNAMSGVEAGIEAVNRKVRGAKQRGQLPPIAREIRVGKLVGGMSSKARQKVIDDFQIKGIIDVLIFSIPIATGLTLTRAQDALFLERMWRPADLVQAEDRLHRIGQENAVEITYLDAEGTIDTSMGMLLVEKSKAFAAVIDGVDLTDDDASALVFGEMLDGLGVSLDTYTAGKVLSGAREGDDDLIENSRDAHVIEIFNENGEWIDTFGEDSEPMAQNPGEDLDHMVLTSWNQPL